MSTQWEQIADLYFQTGTVQFGEFSLSSHRANPDLPLSPWYMHYPETHELLDALHNAVGSALASLAVQHGLINHADALFSPIPNGARQIGEVTAQNFDNHPENLIQFTKRVTAAGSVIFSAPSNRSEERRRIIPLEDHVTTAENAVAFVLIARKLGYAVTDALCVVDREQGGKQRLASYGVRLLPLMTATQLLTHGVENSYISQETFEQVQNYQLSARQ